MYEIPVFKAERDAGLENAIRTQANVAFASEIEVVNPFEISAQALAHLKYGLGATKGSTEDFDLHYLKTVLVSVGWNRNDDVFDRVETWAARRTPEDKPFNYEHNCADIIGHITGNYVVDENSQIVSDSSTIDEVPAKFHVVASAVLYKYWDKPELQKRMDTILREIAEKKWYVSMECLFTGFDYAMIDEQGVAKVVARNEETAFLTKHLRFYGGKGTYEGKKVGRLLRNIVFSGKGLVRKPANPDSVILTQANIVQENSRPVPESGYSQAVQQNTKDETIMATEQDKLIADLRAENEKLQNALSESNVKQVQAQLKTVQDEKAKADEALKVANEKSQKLEADLASGRQEIATLKASIEQKDKEAKAVADQLAEIQTAQKKVSRLAAVKAALKVKDEDADSVKAAQDLADSLMDLSDDKFNAHVSAIAKFTPAQLPPKATPAQEPPKATDKPAPMAGKGSETDPAEKNANPANLDTAVANADPALAATESVNAETEKVRKSIADFFGCEETEE